MPKRFPRLTAAILRLQEKIKKTTTPKFGRAGICVFFIVASIIFAHPVYAGGPVEDTLNWATLLLADLALSIAVVLSKLVAVVIEVLLPIMLYNNFSTSPVVKAGWAIVRDTVNMFFVIVLIAIAFGTIFGNEKFKWQQQIPKLMIFAIVINFSKTLAGLMIDFGQVVMLTFANAIREIAAGNFVQMLGMGDIYALSNNSSIFQSAAKDSNATGVQAFDWFASSVAALIMMFAVLSTMIMLLGILVYRVVMLWVLIVVSPLAWFIGGTGQLTKSGAYGEWWKKFICLVAVGPVLTFFLWLTLVVAGAGNVAGDAGFVAENSATIGQTVGGFVTKFFELNRLISFVISIAMLYAGFEAAQSVCSGAGLAVGKMMEGGPLGNKVAGTMKGLAAKGVAKTARVGGRVIKGGGKFVGRETGISGGVANLKEKMYRGIGKAAGSGVIGRTIGRASTARADEIAKSRAADIASAGEKYKGDTRESKVDQMRRFADSPASSVQGRRESDALTLDAMGNDKSEKEMRASGHWDKNWWDKNGARLEAGAKGNPDMQAKLEAFKKRHADITGSAGQIKDTKDVAGLSAFAMGDAGVQKQLGGVMTTIKRDKEKGGGFYNAADAIKEGLLGTTDQRNAFNNGGSAVYEGMSAKELGRVPPSALAANVSVDLLAKNPSLATQLISSSDKGVHAGLKNRLSGDKTGDLAASLGAGAGLDLKGGKVTNKALLAQTIAQNPMMLSTLGDQAISSMGKDPAQMTAMAEVFNDKGAMKSVVGAIRSKAGTPEGKELQAKAEQIFNLGKGTTTVNARNTFDTQMGAIAIRQKRIDAITTTASQLGGAASGVAGRGGSYVGDKASAVASATGGKLKSTADATGLTTAAKVVAAGAVKAAEAIKTGVEETVKAGKAVGEVVSAVASVATDAVLDKAVASTKDLEDRGKQQGYYDPKNRAPVEHPAPIAESETEAEFFGEKPPDKPTV